MKLFTSLAASAALAQAQDFPGFGGSIADLLAQLNIENQLSLGDLGADIADANATVDASEFDPITGERYLIAQPPPGPNPETPFTNDCTGDVTNDASRDCNPCLFDPAVCNGSQEACNAVKDDGVTPLGIDEDSNTWIYECNCVNHNDPHFNDGTDADTPGWAGPDCQCSRCHPHDGSDGLTEDSCAAPEDDANPCAAAEAGDDDDDIIPNNLMIDPSFTCKDGTDGDSSKVGTNEFECLCDASYYGDTCDSQQPCGAGEDAQTVPDVDICNGANGVNDQGGDVCNCVCESHPDNVNLDANDARYGTNCEEDICGSGFGQNPPACANGAATVNIAGPTNAVCECTCETNWQGELCDEDFCADHVCMNGGTVNRSVQGECSCNCPAGFSGADCSIADIVPEGDGCWKCDAMTYVQCATEGTFQKCSEDNTNGDNGVCFVEYREQNQQLTQLCTGCKDATSCDNLKRQNFVPGFNAGNTAPYMRMRNQCKPDYRLQVARRRYGNTQSVCRQCFAMCNNGSEAEAQKCFGGLGANTIYTASASDEDKINNAQWIRYYKTIVGGPESGSSSPWNGGIGGSTDKLLRKGVIANNEAIVLGIPLHMTAANAADATIVDSSANHIFRGYKKADLAAIVVDNEVTAAAQAGDTSQSLFWSLADATDYFWQNDLLQEQGTYGNNPADGSVSGFATRGYSNAAAAPCKMDYGNENYCDRS